MRFGKSRFRASDAYAMLSSELAAYRELPYDELTQLVGERSLRRVTAADSTEYAIEVIVRWLDLEGGDVRVVGWVAVDDCGPVRRLDDAFVVARPD